MTARMRHNIGINDIIPVEHAISLQTCLVGPLLALRVMRFIEAFTM